MNSEQMLESLEALPSYETRLVTFEVAGRTFTRRWMPRDIPRKDRRFTCLDSGMEVWPRQGQCPLTITSIDTPGKEQMT